ncbi:MAG: helix-turn-helix transcriptional regulator, partial [Verrucomicrobiota bacterium]
MHTACTEWEGQSRSQPKQSVCSIRYTPHFSTIGERQASEKCVPTKGEMDAKAILGRFVRKLREQSKLTQEQLARKAGITYQYLSGLENGRENFSIDILESVSQALNLPLEKLVVEAFSAGKNFAAPMAEAHYFRRHVPLPPGMDVRHLEAAINATQMLVARISSNLVASGAKPLPGYIQGNNFSGLVSNVLCDALHEHSPYKHNSGQAYPDLINPNVEQGGKPVGLEVKSTVQIGKGGESHNGHSGWHLFACFQIEEATGFIRFVHVMLAVLNGHTRPQSDWVYVGSKVNATTGSRR